MKCYKNMTFCAIETCSKFKKCPEGRALTPAVELAADEWWGQGEGQAPIMVFGDYPKCYTKSKEGKT